MYLRLMIFKLSSQVIREYEEMSAADRHSMVRKGFERLQQYKEEKEEEEQRRAAAKQRRRVAELRRRHAYERLSPEQRAIRAVECPMVYYPLHSFASEETITIACSITPLPLRIYFTSENNI